MSKATNQAFSSYRRNRTVLSFRERYRLTVFVSNGTVAVMAQRGVSLKSVLTCYEKNKMIFFFIWAVIDFMTINISWFLLNIKQHPSPISRKPQTVLNGWMAWIVCIVLFSYHKCACPMSRAIAATFWPRGRRALRARRPRGPNVKNPLIGAIPLLKLVHCFILALWSLMDGVSMRSLDLLVAKYTTMQCGMELVMDAQPEFKLMETHCQFVTMSESSIIMEMFWKENLIL